MKNYNKYQLEWMINHGYTLENLIQQLDEMREMYEADGIEDYTIADLFAEWEFNTGFNGEIWACYGEWLECEEV